jgi:NADH-quinone oxidoreductase subunit L
VYAKHKAKAVEPQLLADGYRYDATVSAFMGGPGRKLFEAIAWFDEAVIDGAVNGSARAVRGAARQIRKGQTGNMRNYAGILGIGAVLLLAWFVLARGVL